MGIKIKPLHEVFCCTRNACHATGKTGPWDERWQLNISGTGIREMLRAEQKRVIADLESKLEQAPGEASE